MKIAKIIFMSLFFILLAASNARADAAWEVYTYDSGNFLSTLFTAMSTLTSSGESGGMLRTLTKIALIMGVLGAFLSYTGLKSGADAVHALEGESFGVFLRHVLLAAGAMYLLMVPRANVNIVDRYDPGQNQTVQDVPFVTAVVAHVSSRIGDKLGASLDDLITEVDAVKFSSGGMALGARYLNEILDISAPDAPANYGGEGYVPINVALGEYFTRCVFSNFGMLSGSDSKEANGLRLLITSPYLLGAFSDNIFRSPDTEFNAQLAKVDDPDKTTCANAPDQIQSAWDGIFDNWLKQFNYAKLGYNSLDDGGMQQAQALFARYFGWSAVSDWKQNIMQIAAVNSLRTEITFHQLAYGGSGSAETMMEKKVGEGWIYAAKLFNKVVMTMRQLAEALVYTSSLFLPVLFVIGGLQVLFFYIKVNLWLQLWVPIFVILNAFADHQLSSVLAIALSNAATPEENWGISSSNIELIRQHANLILGYIGAFSWSVPTLAWAIMKGGDYAMSQAVSAIGAGGAAGHGEKTALHTGSEVGGGGRPQVAPVMNSPVLTGVDFPFKSGIELPLKTGKMDFLREHSQDIARMMGHSQLAGEWGGVRGKGLSQGVEETAFTAGQSQHGAMRALRETAEQFKYPSVEKMVANTSRMEPVQRAQMTEDIANRYNLSREEASVVGGALGGNMESLNKMGFKAGVAEVGGLGNMTDQRETMSRIEAGSGQKTLEMMGERGLTPGEVGEARARSGIAGREVVTAGLMKDGDISGKEIMDAHKVQAQSWVGEAKGTQEGAESAGRSVKEAQELTSSVRTQAGVGEALGKVKGAQAVGMSIKDAQELTTSTNMQKDVGAAEGTHDAARGVGKSIESMQRGTTEGELTNKSTEFDERRKLARGLDTSLAGVSSAMHRSAELSLSNEEAAKGHLEGGAGEHKVAWDEDGNIVYHGQKAGSSLEQVDVNRHVHDYQDMDKAGVLISRGTKIDSDTAFQMALNEDKALVKPVTNEFNTDKEREAQIAVLSRTLGNAASEYLRRQGISADYAKGSAGVGGNLIVFKAGGEIGGERRDQKTTNLMTQEYDTLIRDTFKQAAEQKLNIADSREFLSSRIADKTDKIYREAHNNSPDKYGATAPGDLINKYIDNGAKTVGNGISETPQAFGPR